MSPVQATSLNVRAQISFYHDDKLVHQIFKAIWLPTKHVYKSFKSGNAYDLLICDVAQDGNTITTHEHSTLPAFLYGSRLSVIIVLFGKWKQEVRVKTETKLEIILTSGTGACPEVKLIKHSLLANS